MTPLRLEVNFTYWRDVGRFDTFMRLLVAHISHTRHLTIGGYVRNALQLVSSAPTLESLSLWSDIVQSAIPVNLFNCDTPSLTSLKLNRCDISWKAPLLKGLRNLKIIMPSAEARPELEDWLDALNDMPQLETLSLESASPQAASLISGPSRIVTLPFLTRFYISSSANDCALALVHLELPALTGLHVEAESFKSEGEDVRLLIPYVARNAYTLQSTNPLRGYLISGRGKEPVDIVARTKPDAIFKFNEV